MKQENKTKRFCLALDLKNEKEAIEAYKFHHRSVPEEIIKSITTTGITVMDIYITGNRLFMIMEVNESFSFDEKAELDSKNEAVQAWERLMDDFQQQLPWAKRGEKWVLMDRIFSLNG